MSGSHVYGLAQAASGYHKVLEENRELYNEVQDLKGKLNALNPLCAYFYSLDGVIIKDNIKPSFLLSSHSY